MVALAFGQVGFNRRLDWRLRSLLALLIVLVFLRGLAGAPGWISGWLPPAIALYGALAIGAPALTGWLTLAGAVVAALLVPSMASFVLAGDNPYSLGTRLDAWRIMGEIIAAQPILGSGPANYYFQTPQYEIRGYAVSFSSHNTYIDITAQTGILGSLCLVAFVVAMGRRILALRGRCGRGFTNGFFVGATGGFVGTLAAGMLGDWIFPFVYNVGLDGLRTSLPAWALLGGLHALGRVVERPQAQACSLLKLQPGREAIEGPDDADAREQYENRVDG
jgi:O-antigen ligase